jgi:hexosaminidase
LQSFVIAHAEKVLKNNGKKMIGWEEILQGGVSKTATIMSWRGFGAELTAARLGNNVILTPKTHLYFDYYQSRQTENEPFAIGGYVPVEQVYAFSPVLENLTPAEQKYVLGVQANLWTEYMPTFSHIQYMLLPRLAALSEVQWMQEDKKDYACFTRRVPLLIEHYKHNGYNFRNTFSDSDR